jgi:twinkle protein
MGKIIGDTGCPKCIEKGKDKTKNHLILFDNGNGYCTRCGYKEFGIDVDSLPPRPIKSPEDIQADLDLFLECPIRALSERNLSKETAEHFGVRCFVSELDGNTPTSHLYPYGKGGKLSGINVRLLADKEFYGMGNRKEVDPFGYGQAKRITNKKRVIVVEDELSTMSVWQAFNTCLKDKRWMPAIIGLATSPQGILQELGKPEIHQWLNSFEEIIFCLDMDDAGREGYQKALELYPEAKTVDLSHKDPNDMTMAGKELDLYNAIAFSSRVKGPSGSVTMMDLMDRILTPPTRGLDYPWPETTESTLGFKTKQIITIASGVGLGKTLLANTMAAWFQKEHNLKSGMVMLEQPAEESARAILSAMTGTQFNDPNAPFQRERVEQAAKAVSQGFMFFDLVANTEWNNVKEVIRHWVVYEGCKIIFLDNLTTLTAHLTPTEINTAIGQIMSDLAAMVQKYDFTVYVFSHLNPVGSGTPHERGGEVQEHQMTGSRHAMRYSSFVMGFERNRDPDVAEDLRNLSRLTTLKCRVIGSKPGVQGLRYNPLTGLLDPRTDTNLPESPKGGSEEGVM